jgi:hypothetical protein
MKAKLVTFVFTTRVVVNDDCPEDLIVEFASRNMQERISNEPMGEYLSNCSEICDDLEMPANEETDNSSSFGFYANQTKKDVTS